ncbi:MAG: VWA domain-containing protein [Candidatus Eisenbacteria bacterium]|nr:VWA domain-containing protein [Candidatus Eisenbacteria bacterium]
MRSGTIRLNLLLFAALFALCAASTAGAYGVDWVVLVDNTGTMRYQNRAEMTVKAIEDFVSLTERGDRISICSYGERAAPVLPVNPVLIEDESSKDYVMSHTTFGFNADRTDITAGLEYVWQERARLFPGLAAGKGKGADAVIVLLTDGKLIPVYDSYANYEKIYKKSRGRLLELASLCADQGIRICTIGLGRANKVDGGLLEEVSARTGGTYRHVPVASDVMGAYRAIADEQRSLAPLEVVKGSPVLEFQDTATASETSESPREKKTADGRAGARLSSAFSAFSPEFCLGTAGILAVFIGMVAVGTEKRQKWAMRFSTSLFGTGEKRVRGYLKPIDEAGMTSARACIGLENSGVESVRVGSGTSFLPQSDATMEFTGTRDGSPPDLHVESGSVTVEGEAVTVRKLRDGDIVDIEGHRYQYLRGNRR